MVNWIRGFWRKRVYWVVACFWRNRIWATWIAVFNALFSVLLDVTVFQWEYWVSLSVLTIILFLYGDERVRKYRDLQDIKDRLAGK